MHKLLKFRLLLITALISFSTIGAVYQAETALLFKAAIETEHSGFNGDGYVNFDNELGTYLELRIGLAVSGRQNIIIRYANGSSSSRPMRISLNDTTVDESVVFEPTGGWANWDTMSVSVNINAGISKLRFTSTGSEGGPNLDQFDISGEQLPTYNLNLSTSGDGSILQIPGNGPLFAGQEIMLIARPGWASIFKGWSGDYSGTTDTLQFVLDSDKSVHATFETIELEIPDPDFSMIGYASVSGEGLEGTIGGKGGNKIVIETLEGLRTWGASRENNSTPEIVVIKGFIDASTTEVITIKRGGNISILGDSDSGDGYAELKNVSFNIRDYSNVIIRNLKMHEVLYPNDDLTIDHCHHVWIDHCELYSKIGNGVGVDTYDGLLDVKKGSHNVTVSWCYFHDHMKTMLIGHSDNNGEQDQNLQLTMHHNWFSNTNGRNPSLRFGTCHYFNNYLENIDDYGFAARNGAHAKIENCHFESVNIPVATDKFEGHGFACISGCIYTGTCTEADNQVSEPLECSFWDGQITYNYEFEDVNTVRLSVNAFAGVGKISTVTSAIAISKQDKFFLESVYFNKTENSVNITFSSPEDQPIQFSIYSLSGVKLLSKTGNTETGYRVVKLPVDGLSHGVYIVVAKTGNSGISRKIVL